MLCIMWAVILSCSGAVARFDGGCREETQHVLGAEAIHGSTIGKRSNGSSRRASARQSICKQFVNNRFLFGGFVLFLCVNKQAAAISHLLHGYSLCGAGGGGFMIMLTKKPAVEVRQEIETRDSALGASGRAREGGDRLRRRGYAPHTGVRVPGRAGSRFT